MIIKVSREQTNRSKKKPIYKYTAEVNDYCCDTTGRKNRGLIVFTGEGVYPALHGRVIGIERYSYCPWCGEEFEFIYDIQGKQ